MGGDPKSRPHPPPRAWCRGSSPGTAAGPLGGTPAVPRAWGTFRDSAAALQSSRLAKQSERCRRVRPAGGCRSRRGENRGRCAPRAGAKLPRSNPRSGARRVSPLRAGRRPPPTAPGPASLPLASASSPFFSFSPPRRYFRLRRLPPPLPPRRGAEPAGARRGRLRAGVSSGRGQSSRSPRRRRAPAETGRLLPPPPPQPRAPAGAAERSARPR